MFKFGKDDIVLGLISIAAFAGASIAMMLFCYISDAVVYHTMNF